MSAVGATHRGNVRTENQDAFFTIEKENCSIFAVADGLGGHRSGNVASQLCVKKIKAYFADVDINECFEDPIDVRTHIKQVNTWLHDLSVRNAKLKGMGTTLTLAMAMEDQLLVFHAGDSRAYRISDGNIQQITVDHSLVQQMVEQGQITEEEALLHPQKHIITRAVGTEEQIKIDIYRCPLEEDDAILLCTDGLTNHLPEEEIAELVKAGTDKEKTVQSLVEAALERGGTDNLTVVLYDNRGTK